MYKVIEQEKCRNKSVIVRQYQFFRTKRKAIKFIKKYVANLSQNYLGHFDKINKTNFKYSSYYSIYHFEIVDSDFDYSPIDQTINIIKYK